MDFVYCKDNFLLKKEVNKLLEKYQNQENEIVFFSFIDDQFSNIIQTLQTFPIFSDKKVVVLKDCWFVSDSKISLHKTFNLPVLLSFLKKGLPDNLEIIFTLNSDKFSKKNKTAIWFKDNCQIKAIDALKRQKLEQFVLEGLNQKISQEAIDYLLNNLPNDLQIIDGEVKKIFQLQKNIELIDVKKNLTKYFEQDIFEISNYFLTNDLANFLKQYQNYRLTNNDHLPLITLLSNNLAILRNALILKKQEMNVDEIAQKLEINGYRLKLLLKTNKNTIQELNGRINMLYNLSKDLILGKMDQQIIPEYEFIKILNNKFRR